jgi:hypothetical protein
MTVNSTLQALRRLQKVHHYIAKDQLLNADKSMESPDTHDSENSWPAPRSDLTAIAD